ncbi:MAG: mevalonate kinase [Myxococcota bacterium]
MANAFGKIILAGEHAVVYGYPAIAQTINKEVSVRASQSFGKKATFHFLQPALSSGGEIFDQVLARLTVLLGDRVQKLSFDIESNVPGGCGLGSSAALSVALIRSVLDFYEETRTSGEVAAMAMDLEKIFHGNPSGVDHTTIAHEGLIWFQKGKLEPVLSAKPLKFEILMGSPHRGTLKAVQSVRDFYEAEPMRVRSIFEEIEALTYAMRKAIKIGDLKQVGLLMNQNHALLKSLGVSTPELDALCEQARQKGALGAKLTGAGGGGCVIALV